MEEAYIGIDIGSISTKGVVLDAENRILASEYIWTEGDPIGAAKKLLKLLEEQFDKEKYSITAAGTTGSARKLVGDMIGATVVKNEITAHAVGTTTLHPDVRTILEIGGQDSKIILVENGVAVDYAMNTLCAAGTGSFLSSQSKRLGVDVEEFGKIALQSKHPTQIAARCTVFAESDPGPQDSDGSRQGGHHSGSVPGRRQQLPEQRGKGQKNKGSHRLSGRCQQKYRRSRRLSKGAGLRYRCGRDRTSHGRFRHRHLGGQKQQKDPVRFRRGKHGVPDAGDQLRQVS